MRNLTWSLLVVGLLAAFTAAAPAQDASEFHARMLEAAASCLEGATPDQDYQPCIARDAYMSIVNTLNAADPWKNAVEHGTFDAARAKMRYYHERYDCEYHGDDPAQPSCQTLTVYKAALQTHGWCLRTYGVHDWQQRWVSCDALETP